MQHLGAGEITVMLLALALLVGTARLLGERADILPGLGHALMLESGWEEVARHIEDWLTGVGF